MDPERNVLVCYMIMDASDVMKKALLATITDPFETFERKVNAPNDGYIINANLSPIVYQGDAVYHKAKQLEMESSKKLRAKYKALRSQLSENDVETMSLAITNLLLTLPIWEKTYFHIFYPLQNKRSRH
jgi:hypothetical protein